MGSKTFISLDECCKYYSVQKSFVQSLHEHGLIEFRQEEEQINIDVAELQALDKFRRLYYELDINMEGIEVIHRLLESIDHLHAELRSFKP